MEEPEPTLQSIHRDLYLLRQRIDFLERDRDRLQEEIFALRSRAEKDYAFSNNIFWRLDHHWEDYHDPARSTHTWKF